MYEPGRLLGNNAYCRTALYSMIIGDDNMGKQINYYMEFDSFIQVADKALKSGCEIIIDDHTRGIIIGKSLDMITTDCTRYYFHVSEAGDIAIKLVNGKKRIDNSYSASGVTLIEAGYSFISSEKMRINRARLFCITDYYDSNGVLIKRPECVTKIYNSLSRCVKKIAPYTEIIDTVISTQDESYLQEIEYRHKEYITDNCLILRNSGYKLC